MTLGKANSGAQSARYHLSAHIGVCAHGEDIRLLAINIGDKEVWRGEQAGAADLTINKTSLFGGDEKEGGVSGTISWLPGAVTQTLATRLATRLGLTTATCPGFRGLASLFFTGAGDTGGFYWIANNPYLKPVSVRIRRRSIGLSTGTALIDLPNDSKGRAQKASNPAHIIYECLTNRDWGKGGAAASIDIDSFEAAADTLFDEDFGLAMLWRRQSKIEDFVGEILDHIQAVLFDHPTTGKQTLKLLRADYDFDNVRVMDPDNARLSNFRRKVWGEISNEVVVTWTNPETEKEETVSSHDLAAIARQGATISASRNYYGVRSSALALRLAERDLAAMASPIAACDAELNRTWRDLVPGEVIKLNWPEHGLTAVAMRVIKITRGKRGGIRASLQEDIFGMATSSYGAPVPSGWEDTSQDPEDLSGTIAMTAPAFLTTRVLGIANPASLAYPTAVASFFAIPNGPDDYAFDLHGPQTLPTGTVVDAKLITLPFNTSGLLAASLAAEATSTLGALTGLTGQPIQEGDFLVVGGTESASEIMLVMTVDGLGGCTVRRGLLDTVPRPWSSGSRVFVLSESSLSSDTTERAVAESLTYKLLTRTSRGILPIEDATGIPITLSERPHLPLRPANVKVDGVGFGVYTPGALVTDFVVTWANRNHLTEATQPLAWTAASVTPVAGQTVTVEVLDDAETVVASASGLSGTTHTVARTAFGALTSGYIRVVSVLAGDRSLQAHKIRLEGL